MHQPIKRRHKYAIRMTAEDEQKDREQLKHDMLKALFGQPMSAERQQELDGMLERIANVSREYDVDYPTSTGH